MSCGAGAPGKEQLAIQQLITVEHYAALQEKPWEVTRPGESAWLKAIWPRVQAGLWLDIIRGWVAEAKT